MALQVAQHELAEITHENRRALVLGDDDISHVLQSLHDADAADDVPELAAVQNAATSVRAVCVDSVSDVLERQVEPHELLRVELELKLGREAAEVLDVGNARHLLQCRDHRPSLNF